MALYPPILKLDIQKFEVRQLGAAKHKHYTKYHFCGIFILCIDFRLSTRRHIGGAKVNELRAAAGEHTIVDPYEIWDELHEGSTLAVCSAWTPGRQGRLLGLGTIVGDKEWSEIPSIIVEEASRRQGIATAIGDRLIAAASEAGVARLEAEVTDPAAVNLFVGNLGFRMKSEVTAELHLPVNPSA